MVGYVRCKSCGIADVEYHRQHLKLRLTGHLYVASTPYGLKIGRSCEPDRRMAEPRRGMSAGSDVRLLKVFEDIGHLEPFIHFELNERRATNFREVFNCNRETVQATIDRLVMQNK